MDRTAALTNQDAHYKAKAHNHLSEAKRILRHLSAERERARRRGPEHPSLLSEVKAILHGI